MPIWRKAQEGDFVEWTDTLSGLRRFGEVRSIDRGIAEVSEKYRTGSGREKTREWRVMDHLLSVRYAAESEILR